MKIKKLHLCDVEGDLATYFNWSINALWPLFDGAHGYFIENRLTIRKVALELLQAIGYKPEPIYRGILLKAPVAEITPHQALQFLSFTTDKTVAENFADPNGFGSEHLDVESRLGKYGYVIEHRPELSEILFHYEFLSFLPFDDAFTMVNIDGPGQVAFLQSQKEITILQPLAPFKNLTKQF